VLIKIQASIEEREGFLVLSKSSERVAALEGRVGAEIEENEFLR
jgi:hypothetical protein